MIIVTGGGGFIGSAIVRGLNDRGQDDILIVDQKLEGSPKDKNLAKRSYKDYLESDIFLKRLESGAFDGQITAIFHEGACSSTTEKNKDYLRENNSRYSERLAEWAIRHDVYFSYASSAAVYGSGECGYSDDDSLNSKLQPLNPYGQSKLDFDLWVLKNNYQNKVTGFRYFNVYGPNEYHKEDMRSMVQKGFEQILRDGRLRLFKSYRPEYPDGGQKRDFIYVKDVVDVILWFYDHPDQKGIYNLGTGHAQSWNDLATSLFHATNKDPVIEYFDMPDTIRNQYQYFTQADLSKLRSTGCPAEFRNLEAGVSDYVGNYLSLDDPYF